MGEKTKKIMRHFEKWNASKRNSERKN